MCPMWPSHMFPFSMGMKYVRHFFLHHHQCSVRTLCSDKNTSIKTGTYHHSILHEFFPRRKCILVVFNIYEVFTKEMESRTRHIRQYGFILSGTSANVLFWSLRRSIWCWRRCALSRMTRVSVAGLDGAQTRIQASGWARKIWSTASTTVL